MIFVINQDYVKGRDWSKSNKLTVFLSICIASAEEWRQNLLRMSRSCKHLLTHRILDDWNLCERERDSNWISLGDSSIWWRCTFQFEFHGGKTFLQLLLITLDPEPERDWQIVGGREWRRRDSFFSCTAELSLIALSYRSYVGGKLNYWRRLESEKLWKILFHHSRSFFLFFSSLFSASAQWRQEQKGNFRFAESRGQGESRSTEAAADDEQWGKFTFNAFL